MEEAHAARPRSASSNLRWTNPKLADHSPPARDPYKKHRSLRTIRIDIPGLPNFRKTSTSRRVVNAPREPVTSPFALNYMLDGIIRMPVRLRSAAPTHVVVGVLRRVAEKRKRQCNRPPLSRESVRSLHVLEERPARLRFAKYTTVPVRR